MAAPTNVRVESNAADQNTLRWTDNGGASNKIYHSTDGSSYTLVDTIALGVELFVDTGLTQDTLYYYKITNDNGSTYSSPVTVYTQQCDFKGKKSVRTVSSEASVEELSTHVDYLLNEHGQVGADSPSSFEQCFACVNTGRLILDCTLGCRSFVVEDLTEDINSITIIGCGTCPPVDFQVAADTTVGVCGWPSDLSCEFAGDECFEAPIEGGPEGRTARTVGASTPGINQAAASPGGGGACTCVFPVTIRCNQSVSTIYRNPGGAACEDFDNPAFNTCYWEYDIRTANITLSACGGTPPYTWSVVNQGDCVACCYSPGVNDIAFSVNPTLQAGDETVASLMGCYLSDVNHEEIDILCTDDDGNSLMVNGFIGF